MNVSLGEGIQLNVSKLIETRMLVQANSGGGKSYLIRKLLEATYGKVPHVVLDIEGEFSSLREEYDYVLAGPNGDIPTQVRSADALAKKVLELGISLIVDLSELKAHERVQYVRYFLESLLQAPREAWRDLLVVVDEAHQFAPEKGDCQALNAIIDLAARGRKRGFCAVIATQRLSKLHKDVAAECLNKMIGRTSLDIDRKRAGNELGFASDKDSIQLRTLKPGEFFFFGPALNEDVLTRAVIGKVKTSHGQEARKITAASVAPSSTVKKALEHLKLIPQEVEKQIKDLSYYRDRVVVLEKEVSKRVDTSPNPREIEKAVLAERVRWVPTLKNLIQDLSQLSSRANMALAIGEARTSLKTSTSETSVRKPVKQERPSLSDSSQNWSKCERAILSVLNINPSKGLKKEVLGVLSGYAHSSGGFNNALSSLSAQQAIERREGLLWPLVRSESASPDLKNWLSKLGKCERAIYEEILKDPYYEFTKKELAEKTGYTEGSGGFNNSLSHLVSLGLIERRQGHLALCFHLQPYL